MQPNKSLPEMRFFDHGGTMAGIYPAENKFASQHKRLVRMLTVVAYLLCVSLAAILLSLYYLFLWNPDMNKDLPDIQSRFTKELCSSAQQQVQSQQHAQYVHTEHNLEEQPKQPPGHPGATDIVNSPPVVSKVPLGDRPIQRIVSDSTNKATDPSAPSRRSFVPYPAAVFGSQPGLFPLFPDPLNPLSALTPLGGQIGQPLKGPLDLSLNPPAHDMNADLQTLSQAASSDSASLAIPSTFTSISDHQPSEQQQTRVGDSSHLFQQSSSAQANRGGDPTAPSSTESLVDDDSKRSSSNSQEGPEVSSSQEVLTYQDGSALNSSNVSSSEY